MNIVVSLLLSLSSCLQFPLRVICSYFTSSLIQNSSYSHVSSFNPFSKSGNIVHLSFQKSCPLKTFNWVWSLEKTYPMKKREFVLNIQKATFSDIQLHLEPSLVQIPSEKEKNEFLGKFRVLNHSAFSLWYFGL